MSVLMKCWPEMLIRSAGPMPGYPGEGSFTLGAALRRACGTYPGVVLDERMSGERPILA
jgi:hypothetical protein